MDREIVALETELPEGERRERLLQALARVIALRGYEAFINAPILRPSAEYFPEPVERTLRGAGVLVLRLLRYAKLNPLPVLLTGYQNRTGHVAEGISLHDPQLKAAAWYAGIQEGVCHFGLELRGLRDDSALLAALAHEVTHAYRDRHSLAVRDRDAEEKLTDLTAVYLGFGVFLANASHRVETGGYSEGGRLSYERHSLGYLSPAEFALLLATQVVTRGNHESERRKVRGALSPNHSKEGYEFAAYYISNHQLRRRDLEILSTANTIRADRGTLLRFSAILDRRLIEWRAREGDTPSHQL